MRVLSNDNLPNIPGSRGVLVGGTTNFARQFFAHLREAGHEWIGVINRPTEQDKPYQKTVHEENGSLFKVCYFSREAMKGFITEKRKKIDPRAHFALEVALLRRLIKRLKPDVVFLNGYSIFGWLLLEAGMQEGIPIVIQHAGIACIEYDLYRHIYTDVFRTALLEMEKDTVRLATHHIFLNDFSRRTFFQHVLPVPAKQVTVIPLPYEVGPKVGTTGTARGAAVRKKEEVFIGCVARWDRIKNHEGLLALAREAQSQELPWKFECVTKVPDTPKFRAFKQEYRQRIHVLPPMSRKSLVDFYRRMDVLVLPSHFDVSPTVVIEAAAENRPTIISPNVGWVAEYGDCGMKSWIADFTRPSNVIKRIQAVLKDQSPLTVFQESLHRYHAPSVVFQAYIQLFTEMI